MKTTDSRLATAQAYADGVRALFAPAGAPTDERGVGGPVSPTDLADKAESLSTLSASLTTEAGAKLATAEEPRVKAQTSTQLLAKALTDLEVSAYLLQAAEDERANRVWARSEAAERSATGHASVDELLKIVAGEASLLPAGKERGGRTPKNLASARQGLTQTVDDVLTLISKRASQTGQAALSGLLGIGLVQIGQAAGLIGQNIAQAFGQAETLSRLYQLFRDFAFRAYDSVVALLGPTVAQAAGQRVLEWIDEVKEAKFFGTLLEKLYETNQTRQELSVEIADSKADLQKFVAARDRVSELVEEYTAQLRLTEKLLKGLKYLGSVPVAILPYGSLLMAAVYIVLCAYVVLAGADYVDAPHLSSLHRVLGVRQVVEVNLAG